jgi:uncharacterized membrane protein YqjE
MRILDGTKALRLIQMTRSAVAEARDLRRNAFRLLRLDAELAAASANTVAILSVATLVLILSSWVLLVSALVAFISANWLSLPATLLVVALIVLAVAIPCAIAIRSRASDLTFDASRRQLARPGIEVRPARPAAEIRREIAVLESRIAGEKQDLQNAVRSTRGLLGELLSSRRTRAGLFIAAIAAGALASMRVRALSRAAAEDRRSRL